MTVTVTKFRPDGTTSKQVFVDFEDDMFFDEAEYTDYDEFETDEGNQYDTDCDDCCPHGGELDGQMTIEELIKKLAEKDASDGYFSIVLKH